MMKCTPALRMALIMLLHACASCAALPCGINMALHKPAKASSEVTSTYWCGGTCSAAKAVDGTVSGTRSRWLPKVSGQGNVHTITIDLQGLVEICEVVIIGEHLCDHRVSVDSDDGINWKTAFTQDKKSTQDVIRHDNVKAEATRVRVDFYQNCLTKNGVSDFNLRIHEIQVYGKSVGKTTTVPTTTAQATTTNTNVQALQLKLDELGKAMATGDTSSAALLKDLGVVQASLKLLDTTVTTQASTIDTLVKALKGATDDITSLKKSVAALQAPLVYPEVPSAPSCSGATCRPAVEADDNSLQINAPSGSVSFNSAYCDSVSICDLASILDLIRAPYLFYGLNIWV